MSGRLAWLLPALPAVAALVVLLAGSRLRGRGVGITVGLAAADLGVALALAPAALAHPRRVVEVSQPLVPGIGSAVGTRLDGLAAVLALTVTTVAFLVQIYSTRYLSDRRRYPAYAAFISLFSAAMLLVVVSSDLLELLVGWEVMGICSYLLIGHHWEDPPAADAAISAFLTTRLGDLGFTAGLFVLGSAAGTFRITGVLAATAGGTIPHGLLTVAGLLLLAGVIGKSAQFPLQTWLPDAMAGPTPVSALIHAATMVAAGVYVVARLYPVITASAVTVDALAVVAAITMVFGALAALAHDDLKRVLAWSTVSQLAYMYGGLAVGGYAAGLYHLLTHAAFKALLFLAAGSVIGVAGTNSMAGMGGLRRGMPVTFVTMTIGLGALAGVPPLSGFVSKDAVLGAAYDAARHGAAVPVGGAFAWLVWAAGLLTAGLTVLYATRVWLRVFFGAPRGAQRGREPALAMTVPLVVLAVPAALLGGLGLARHGLLVRWLAGPAGAPGLGLSAFSGGLAVVLVVLGVLAVVGVWRARPAEDPARVLGRAAVPLAAGFFLDEVYLRGLVLPVRGAVATATAAFDRVLVDGVVEGSGSWAGLAGRLLRRVQNGNVSRYATGVAIAALLLAVGAAVGARP
ncbi:MAG: NADH-quinone oxidoreductase subunit 5 family protein [Mycobacteriales bacterium]